MSTLGPNVLCYAIIDNRPARLVRIEFQVHSTAAYQCRDESTGATFTYFPQNLKPVNTTPSRYSKHMFEGVAHILAAAVAAYPNAVEAESGNLSIETLARRVREARDAKLRYPHYRFTGLDDIKFTTIGPLLRTKMVERTKGQFVLRVGPKEHLEHPVTTPALAISAPTGDEVVIDASNFDNLERLVKLKSDRVFNPMPNFVVFNITPQQIESLEARYDVGFMPFEDQPNKFQLL